MSKKPSDYEKFLISEYFKHGSINKVFYHHHFNLPISYAGFDRVLTKYKIVKSAGPNSKLTESLRMLRLVADYKLSLEKVYERYAPHKLLVSTNTLHRILHYTRLGLTRRTGTVVILTEKGMPDLFLLGNDMSLGSDSLGAKGDLSLPMSHSKTGEMPRESIARVLQQEVFSDLVLNNLFPWDLIPEHPKPVLFIKIADIKVTVYHLELTGKYNFSSSKLSNHRFLSLKEVNEVSTRPGVTEVLEKFVEIENSQIAVAVPEISSNLNTKLLALAESRA